MSYNRQTITLSYNHQTITLSYNRHPRTTTVTLRVAVVAQCAIAPGIHGYVAGSIPALHPDTVKKIIKIKIHEIS